MAKSRHKSNRQRSQVGSGGGLQDASFLECPDCGNKIGNHNWKSSRGKKNARMRSVRTRSRKGSIGQRSYIRRRYTRSPSRLRTKRGGRRTARSRSTCATRSRRSASGKLRGRRSKTRGKRGRGKSTRGRNVSRASSHARSVCSSSRVSCQRSTARKQQSQSTLSRKGSSTNKRRNVRPCRGARAKRAGRRTARSRSSQTQSTQSQSTTPRKGSTNKRRYVRRPANRRGRAKRGARPTVTRSRSSTSSSSRGRSSTSTAKQSTNRYKRGRGTKYYRGRQASRTSRKSKSSRPTKAKRSRRPTRLGICTCCHQKIKSTDSTQAVADPEQELAPDSARLSSSELSIREEEQPSTTEAIEQQERPSSELSLGEPLTTTNVPSSTPLMVDDDNNRIPIPETNTAPEVRTIIFRPTIVIVQNVFVLPGQLQASSSNNQNSPNVVNVVNQEVFIFPNSNELPPNISAQYGLVNAPTSINQIQTLPASSPVPSSSVAPQSSATSDLPKQPPQ